MKRVGKTPRFKRQRRLQVELPGMGKPGALERKPYPPGQHGTRRRKFSDYALQLEEKQKVLANYCMRESQLKRFVHEAKRRSSSNWVDTLIGDLELRLDNVVFRLGFAPSIPAAKQMVSHGKVLVNGRRVDIRSAILKPGDKVTLKDSAYTEQSYLWAQQQPRLPLPDYLTKEEIESKDAGRITDRPKLEHAPFPFDSGLFTSFYS